MADKRLRKLQIEILLSMGRNYEYFDKDAHWVMSRVVTRDVSKKYFHCKEKVVPTEVSVSVSRSLRNLARKKLIKVVKNKKTAVVSSVQFTREGLEVAKKYYS